MPPPQTFGKCFFCCNEMMLLRSLNVKCNKMSRNRGNLTVVYLVILLETISAATPPPANVVRLRSPREKMLLLTRPPTESGRSSGDHGKCLLLPPPPPNLVGFWRSRKMYRVTSAGCPRQRKILAMLLTVSI